MMGLGAMAELPLAALLGVSDVGIALPDSDLDFTTGTWRVTTTQDQVVILPESILEYTIGAIGVCVDGFRDLGQPTDDFYSDLTPTPDLGCA